MGLIAAQLQPSHYAAKPEEVQLWKHQLLFMEIAQVITDDEYGPYGPCEEND